MASRFRPPAWTRHPVRHRSWRRRRRQLGCRARDDPVRPGSLRATAEPLAPLLGSTADQQLTRIRGSWLPDVRVDAGARAARHRVAQDHRRAPAGDRDRPWCSLAQWRPMAKRTSTRGFCVRCRHLIGTSCPSRHRVVSAGAGPSGGPGRPKCQPLWRPSQRDHAGRTVASERSPSSPCRRHDQQPVGPAAPAAQRERKRHDSDRARIPNGVRAWPGGDRVGHSEDLRATGATRSRGSPRGPLGVFGAGRGSTAALAGPGS